MLYRISRRSERQWVPRTKHLAAVNKAATNLWFVKLGCFTVWPHHGYRSLPQARAHQSTTQATHAWKIVENYRREENIEQMLHYPTNDGLQYQHLCSYVVTYIKCHGIINKRISQLCDYIHLCVWLYVCTIHVSHVCSHEHMRKILRFQLWKDGLKYTSINVYLRLWVCVCVYIITER